MWKWQLIFENYVYSCWYLKSTIHFFDWCHTPMKMKRNKNAYLINKKYTIIILKNKIIIVSMYFMICLLTMTLKIYFAFSKKKKNLINYFSKIIAETGDRTFNLKKRNDIVNYSRSSLWRKWTIKNHRKVKEWYYNLRDALIAYYITLG